MTALRKMLGDVECEAENLLTLYKACRQDETILSEGC